MSDIEPSSIIPLIGAAQMEVSLVIVNSLILVILLFLSALVSGSEVAFFSLSPTDLEELKSDKSKKNELVLNLLSKPRNLLAVILVSNNFVNVGIIVLSAFLTNGLLSTPFWIEHQTLLFLVQVVGITFVILLVGEVIPKVFATKNGLFLAKLMAGPLNLVSKTPPFSWLCKGLVYGTDIINKRAKKKDLKLSTDDLEQALALTREDDSDEEEHKILEGIVKFGNTDVKQIMRSRVDTIAINVDSNYEELLEIILESGFSRIPVYEESFDNVIGILYVKDLLAHLNQSNDFDWKTLIRQPFFVPENKKIDDLLKDFQNRKMHMAVVVDEYGGTNGIVTLEDVLEEIVGEITDEFDDDDLVYSKIDENTYIFEGKTPLLDLYKVMDIDGREFEELKGDSDSIAGFMMEQSGKIMRKNERLQFNGFTFVVEASDKKRVKMVKVIRNIEK